MKNPVTREKKDKEALLSLSSIVHSIQIRLIQSAVSGEFSDSDREDVGNMLDMAVSRVKK